MRIKSDARFLINQRKLKKPIDLNVRLRGGVTDARKILNSKLGNKSRMQASSSTGIKRPFPNVRRTVPSSALTKGPQKHVKLSRDGNILITARSKSTGAVNARRVGSSPNTGNTRPKTQIRWAPADADSADLEHVGYGDVLDMDSLPSAVIGSSNRFQRQMPRRSLLEEMIERPDTMVADQILSPQQQTTQVCVSNLHASVSNQDIMELFGDVGVIKSAEMSQPGIATIEYFSAADAMKACDLYHNRLLDGQPMQCYMQQSNTRKSPISQRLGEQIPTHYSSTSSRVMHNPRNVRFTVKLT